jgi:hypothetical protein
MEFGNLIFRVVDRIYFFNIGCLYLLSGWFIIILIIEIFYKCLVLWVLV